MAFNIENKSSLRLNSVPVGTLVDVIDYGRKKVMATGTFGGFRNGKGEVIEAPSVMKNAPSDTTISLTLAGDNVGEPVELVLHKDPAGFGAFGRIVEGKWLRVTVYASTETVRAVVASKAKPEAEAEAEASAEGETVPAEKPKRGRKAKKEVVEPTVEEVTETAEQVA